MIDIQPNITVNGFPAGFRPTGVLPGLPPVRTGVPVSHGTYRRSRPAAGDVKNVSALGLSIPFYPSMWSGKATKKSLENALLAVKQKLEGKFTHSSISQVISRLENLFDRLNFQTLQKSIIILLTTEEEKIFYLGFPLNLLVLEGSNVNVLDLLGNLPPQKYFYMVKVNAAGFTVFSFRNGDFYRIVHDTMKESSEIFRKLIIDLSIINPGHTRPVFITCTENLFLHNSYEEQLAGCWFPLESPQVYHPQERMKILAETISGNWNYWWEKFLASKIVHAASSGLVAGNVQAVHNALLQNADGLLLMDKRFRKKITLRQYNQSDLLYKDLLPLMEKFLARGNNISIAGSRLLKTWGGIVLLKRGQREQNIPVPYHQPYLEGNNIY